MKTKYYRVTDTTDGSHIGVISDDGHFVKRLTEMLEEHFDVDCKVLTETFTLRDARYGNTLELNVQIGDEEDREPSTIQLNQTWVY